ncbi:uncharacterized protein [Ptychodera flava]|uniref:uncharacterized protein n=1 Tax=Ptychodera flava TaxID=63121 RepID=UPI00396A1A3D
MSCDNELDACGGEDDENRVDASCPCNGSGGASLTGTSRRRECQAYQIGQCQSVQCVSSHQHITYPPSCEWKKQHIDRLRFQEHRFDMPKLLCDQYFYTVDMPSVVCKWLSSSERDLMRIISNHNTDSEVKTTDALIPIGLECAARGGANIPYIVEHKVRDQLQRDQFLTFLASFTSNYDVKCDSENTLLKAVTEWKNDDTAPDAVHVSTLMTWIEVCKDATNGRLTRCVLDDLLLSLIRSASHETQCPIRVRVRESTRRDIVVCGDSIAVESSIEVTSHRSALLQVITSTQSTSSCGQKNSFGLPKMACEALSVAGVSPFGNEYFQTVYQLSACVVNQTQGNELMEEFHIHLIRYHIARGTLTQMSACPITNPLQQSYILHEIVPCKTIYSETGIMALYGAFKAVFLIFQKGLDD